MRALFAALMLAMPVRPISDAPKLVSELGHGKPLVLHFFASWCGACREEFPRLRKQLLALPGRGIEVELITIDRPEDREKAEKMLQEYGLSALPSLLLEAPDPDPVAAAVGDRKWDGTLPATFVFDTAGKLRKSFIGVADPGKLEAEIRKVAPRR
jgi:thiol-disulfide isomerase/thioredoxin